MSRSLEKERGSPTLKKGSFNSTVLDNPTIVRDPIFVITDTAKLISASFGIDQLAKSSVEVKIFF
jgi:hypothetical protein